MNRDTSGGAVHGLGKRGTVSAWPITVAQADAGTGICRAAKRRGWEARCRIESVRHRQPRSNWRGTCPIPRSGSGCSTARDRCGASPTTQRSGIAAAVIPTPCEVGTGAAGAGTTSPTTPDRAYVDSREAASVGPYNGLESHSPDMLYSSPMTEVRTSVRSLRQLKAKPPGCGKGEEMRTPAGGAKARLASVFKKFSLASPEHC